MSIVTKKYISRKHFLQNLSIEFKFYAQTTEKKRKWSSNVV